MRRFEAQWLTADKNLLALAELSGQWIDRVHARRPPRGIVLDMDSSASPTPGEQEMSVLLRPSVDANEERLSHCDMAGGYGCQARARQDSKRKSTSRIFVFRFAAGLAAARDSSVPAWPEAKTSARNQRSLLMMVNLARLKR